MLSAGIEISDFNGGKMQLNALFLSFYFNLVLKWLRAA